jgi:hypothetical protein
MATASEKITALKAAFDAMITRVEAKFSNELATPADLAAIDDMTTKAAGLATEPAPAPTPTPAPVPMPPAPEPVTPVEPVPPAPPAP